MVVLKIVFFHHILSTFRVTHLTELLSEAEKEVARRAQLSEALKEEVRRCQRALDRGSHHHNQEYLKNVIVKVKYGTI